MSAWSSGHQDNALFGVMSPCRIPKPENDQFDEYGVSEMKDLWKEWGEDVEGSGQVHPAILRNDLGVAALLLEWQVYKKLRWEQEWSGGSKKDEEVYNILLTTPEYHNFLPTVCITA
jgi:hypothetical protein